jgi:uncharacterized membrane protein YeaQ/YmgE (transglycosylase-associated protein family)
MDLITWLIVGLVAGLLAAYIMKDSTFGIIGDILIGIAGAVLGGWAFKEMGWKAPLTGLAGVIVVAFLGAIVVLFALRLLRRVSGGRR